MHFSWDFLYTLRKVGIRKISWTMDICSIDALRYVKWHTYYGSLANPLYFTRFFFHCSLIVMHPPFGRFVLPFISLHCFFFTVVIFHYVNKMQISYHKLLNRSIARHRCIQCNKMCLSTSASISTFVSNALFKNILVLSSFQFFVQLQDSLLRNENWPECDLTNDS